MLAIPPFGASSNIALWRANNKPPLEVVVANLDAIKVSFVGAVAEKDLDLSRRYYTEVIESMPMPKL